MQNYNYLHVFLQFGQTGPSHINQELGSAKKSQSTQF